VRIRSIAFVLLGGLAAYSLSTLTPYMAPTTSMAPTVLPGDYMLVKKTSGPLRRGEVVWFHPPHSPEQQFLKRVIGLPGDRIRLVNKQVFLNGKALNEPYAAHSTTYTDDFRDNFPSAPNVKLPESAAKMFAENVVNGELVVPEGAYFMLGDSRDNSLDSRYFGCVPESAVTGKPLFIYYSYDKDAGKARWSRTFHRIG
jgi:signal peptidase I